MGGSPERRGPHFIGTDLPTTRSTSEMTRSTEYAYPDPRFSSNDVEPLFKCPTASTALRQGPKRVQSPSHRHGRKSGSRRGISQGEVPGR